MTRPTPTPAERDRSWRFGVNQIVDAIEANPHSPSLRNELAEWFHGYSFVTDEMREPFAARVLAAQADAGVTVAHDTEGDTA